MKKKCDASDAAFLDLLLLNCIFSKKIASVVAGPSSKEIMYCLFLHLLANTSYLDMNEIAKNCYFFLL